MNSIPTVLEVKINIPIEETPTILIATHIPVPKKSSKIVIKKIVKNISGIIIYYYFLKLEKLNYE